MNLFEKQTYFVALISKLVEYAYSKNYKMTFGDSYRDPKYHPLARIPKSGALSNHAKRLAVDLNLFVDGQYVENGDHPAYLDLGSYWEHLDPQCRWGGRFMDANHFSLFDQGVS